MQFIHFGLLPYFLPLVLVPLALHLLTLQRLKTVELSTFRFLFDTYVQQRRKMKLMEALIVFLRTLFVLFLILCIARPVIAHWQSMFVGGSTSRDVVLFVDASASMGAVTDGETALQRAKRASGEIIGRLNSEDRVTIVRVGSTSKEICNRFTSDAEKIRSEINAIKVSPSKANFFTAFAGVFAEDARPLVTPVVYVLTDLQTSAWQEFSSQGERQLIPEETKLVVVNVGSNREFPNVAILGEVDDQHAIIDLPIKLRPRVTNHGLTKTEDVEISVLIDEKEVTRKSYSLQPGETEEVEITFTPRRAGTLKGRFQIANDRFTMDDSFLFTIQVAPRINVLLVNGNPAKEPNDDAGLYLRTAMEAQDEQHVIIDTPLDNPGAIPDALKTETDQIQRTLEITELAQAKLTAATVSAADVIILADCGDMNPARSKWISDAVDDGAGLLVFPGEKVKPDAYNKILFTASSDPERQLTNLKLGKATGDVANAETYLQIDPEASDFVHPILKVFENPEQRFFSNVDFFKHLQVEPLEEAEGVSVIAAFTNGAPAILEGRFGNGKLLFTTFPMHGTWTSLPFKREFVPLVLRMLTHVRKASEVVVPGIVTADGTAEIVVSTNWSPAKGQVSDVKGRKKSIELQRSNSRLVGAYEDTFEKGYYDVDVRGGKPERPKQQTLSFAVNIADGESKFESMSVPGIKRLLPDVDVTVVDASAEAQQAYGIAGNEREIWRPLIILLIVIISIEFLLATTRGAPAEESQPSLGNRLRSVVTGDRELSETSN